MITLDDVRRAVEAYAQGATAYAVAERQIRRYVLQEVRLEHHRQCLICHDIYSMCLEAKEQQQEWLMLGGAA